MESTKYEGFKVNMVNKSFARISLARRLNVQAALTGFWVDACELDASRLVTFDVLGGMACRQACGFEEVCRHEEGNRLAVPHIGRQ